MNRLMSSQKNNNKKSIDHLLFEKNTIFVFFHEEASIRGYTIKPHTLGYTDTNRIDSDRQLTEWKKKNFIYFFYISLSSSNLSTLFSTTMMCKFLWNFRKRGIRNISQSYVFKARKGNGQRKILETWQWKKLQEIMRNRNWNKCLH